MNIRSLTAFRAVMEHGTVTEAAIQSNITQPAMSRLISSLEHDLDIKLFERRRKRLFPTAEAEALYREAQRILAAVDELPRLAQDIRAHAGARLRVVAMPRVAVGFVIPALQRFTEAFPRTNHTIEVLSRTEMELWVSRQHFDVGLGALPTVHAALRTEELCKVPAVAVMSSRHHLANRQSITAEELINEPLVVPIKGTMNRQCMDAILGNAGVPPKIRTECSSGMLACQLAVTGIGITICDALTPRSFIGPEMALVPIEPRFDMAFGILYPATSKPEAATRAFTDILREIVSEKIAECDF